MMIYLIELAFFTEISFVYMATLVRLLIMESFLGLCCAFTALISVN